MKPLIVVEEFEQSYKDTLLSELERRFDIKLETINFILLSSIPRYIDYRGKDCYELSKYKDYTLITDFSPIGTDHNVKQIPSINDITLVTELIAGLFLVPKVYWTDELEIAKKMLARLPETFFAYDIEASPKFSEEEIERAEEALKDDPNNIELLRITRSNALMQEYNVCTMHSFSLTPEKSFVLISTPEIEEYVLEFLTTTEKRVVMHNAQFDLGYIRHRTGQFVKNFEDTILIAQAYLNSVKQPLFSLKALASHINSSWGTAKESFDLYVDSTGYVNENLMYRGSNPEITKFNLPLIYYAGIDTQMTHILWDRFSEIDPEWTSVDIDDILPIVEPKDHQETPRYFYENVLKPILPAMIELTLTPMPIDMNIIDEIKQEAINKREPAMEKLKNFPKVKEYMQRVIETERQKFLVPLIEKHTIEDLNPKPYKNTILHRTLVVNEVLGTNKEKWSIKEIKTKIKELEEQV